MVEKTKFLARVGWGTVLPFYALLTTILKIIDMENLHYLQITYLVGLLLIVLLSALDTDSLYRTYKNKRTQNTKLKEHRTSK